MKKMLFTATMVFLLAGSLPGQLLAQPDRDYGDAPEGVLAYPSLGVMGAFPTCISVGPASWVSHTNFGGWFGPAVDFEPDGNGGLCPSFAPYDNDECFMDGDAGLILPQAYTIDPTPAVVPCPLGQAPPALGLTCQPAVWGANIDIDVHNTMPNHPEYVPGYVNVLIDWNQDGVWGGSSPCPPTGTPAPEHVLVDFFIPPLYIGPLSGLLPPGFLIGPNSGYVWARFSITEAPVGQGWDGSGMFEDGESEDYLLRVDEAQEPTIFPTLTECPLVATECPSLTTECPTIETLCPDIPTWCPEQPTLCPKVPDVCPPDEFTIWPQIPTECPVIFTACPQGPTLCPPLPTDCPGTDTWCPEIPTQCPLEPVFTFCPLNDTQCPDTPTNCPLDWTFCPDIPTVCPDQITLCPEIPTECPVDPTNCPVDPTNCPTSPTFCPLDPTNCPVSPTLCPATDSDNDGVLDCNDNCPNHPNGPSQGTCTLTTPENLIVSTGQFCTVDADCDPGDFCEKVQADNYPPGGNGIGDACDCEGNFDCDVDVDGLEVTAFLADFGRGGYFSPCTNGLPCNGDFLCDGDVDGADVTKFLEDFGRGQYFQPCPVCTGGPWCVYP